MMTDSELETIKVKAEHFCAWASEHYYDNRESREIGRICKSHLECLDALSAATARVTELEAEVADLRSRRGAATEDF